MKLNVASWGWTGRWCLRGLCLTLNTLLWVLFAVQVVVGFGLTARWSTPVQTWALREINARLAPEELRLEAAFFAFDPAGGIWLHEPRLIHKTRAVPLIEAESILLEINLSESLASGQLRVERLAWRGLHTFPPEGTAPLAQSPAGEAHIDRQNHLQLRLALRHAGATLLADIDWDLQLAVQPAPTLRPPAAPAGARLTEALRTWPTDWPVTWDEGMSARIAVEGERGRYPQARVSVWSPHLTTVGEDGWSMHALAAHAQLQRREGEWAWREGWATAARLWGPGKTEITQLRITPQATFPLPHPRGNGGSAAPPMALHFQAAHAAWSDWEATALAGVAQLDLATFMPTTMDARAVFLDLPVRAQAERMTLGDSPVAWAVDLAAQLDVSRTLRLPVVGQAAAAEVVSAARPVDFIGHLQLPERDPAQWRLDFRLAARGFRARDLTVETLTARGHVDRRALHLTHVNLDDGPGQRVHGAFFQAFGPWDFSIAADGHIFPTRLNSVIPRAWYPALWEKITVGAAPVYGDFWLASRWGAQGFTRSITGATGEGLTYQGVAVERARVRVQQRPGLVWLDLADVQSGGGALRGEMAWFRRREDGWRAVELDLAGDLPWATIRQTVGGEPPLIPPDVELAGWPTVAAQGVLWDLNDASGPRDLTFTIDAPDGGEIFRMGFATAQTEGRLSNDRLELSSLTLEQGAGQVTGHIALNGLEAHPAWSIDLQLQDLPDDLFQTLLTSPEAAAAGETSGASPLSTAAEDPAPPGKLSGAVALSGRGGDTATWAGSGQFNLQERPLTTIRIFGALSRALSRAGLPSGSIRLDRAEGRFSVADNQLTWPELIIAGPSTRVSAVGSVNLSTRALDFNATTQLLRSPDGMDLRDLFGVLLRPVTGAFRVALTGTLAAPNWRVTFNPLRSLQRDPAPLPEAPAPEDTPVGPASASPPAAP